MKYYAGLDVSLEETSICVVDGDGAIVAERKVASEPRAIAEARARKKGAKTKPSDAAGAD